jgi:hypothetical protein
MHRARYLLGVLTLVAAIAAAFWIVRLLQQLDDRPGVLVRVEFHDARGLRAGADVRYRGVRAGVVREVGLTADGGKAVVLALLDPVAAPHARLNSTFWIVTPRFAGLAVGATGLDTLVRDPYLAFATLDEPGLPLAPDSLIAGGERPPSAASDAGLDDVGHGDLLMQVLLPENHGLRPGSPVTFRGMRTGEVRAVELVAAGTHVTATIRVQRAYRRTVTDKAVFWVARPQLAGALFTGFRVEDVSALLAPFIAYHCEPNAGLPVDDGFRAVAQAERPDLEMAAVPAEALRQEGRKGPAAADGFVVVRVVYAATERDTMSPDDPVHCEGSGLLFLDGAGRPVVITARSIVDGGYSESDAFGGAAEIVDEQIKVMLPSGSVLHAGRVWVEPAGADLAALVLTDHPAGMVGTPPELLQWADPGEAATATVLRRADADGSVPPSQPLGGENVPPLAESIGAAVIGDGKVFGIYGRTVGDSSVPVVVALGLVPPELRPR